LDIRQLRYFSAVLEHRSFTRAAELLRIAQPALGLQIRKLEEELDVQLLVRHSRGVEPTEAGLLLQRHADDILRRVQVARQELRDLSDEPRGRVTLGLTPSTSILFAKRLIERVEELLPKVQLSIVEELSTVLIEWMRDDRLDLALAYNVPEQTGLDTEAVLRESLFYVQGSAAAGTDQRTVAFAEVAGRPLVMPGMPHGLRLLLEHHAQQEGLELQISVEIQSVSSVRDLVEQGIGTTVLPYGAVARQVEEGRLVARRIVEPEIQRTLFLIASGRRPATRAERALLKIIRTLVGELTRDESGIWLPASRREDPIPAG